MYIILILLRKVKNYDEYWKINPYPADRGICRFSVPRFPLLIAAFVVLRYARKLVTTFGLRDFPNEFKIYHLFLNIITKLFHANDLDWQVRE